jgi:hypothetical protein
MFFATAVLLFQIAAAPHATATTRAKDVSWPTRDAASWAPQKQYGEERLPMERGTRAKSLWQLEGWPFMHGLISYYACFIDDTHPGSKLPLL